jgi:hypothetical protein
MHFALFSDFCMIVHLQYLSAWTSYTPSTQKIYMTISNHVGNTAVNKTTWVLFQFWHSLTV